MNLQELEAWIKTAKYYDTINIAEAEEDWVGENTRIYIKDGEYYAIDFYNTTICEKFGEKGYIRGLYNEPRKVELKSRQVVEWYFLDKEHDYDVGVTYRPHSVPITGQVEYDLNKIVDCFNPPV